MENTPHILPDMYILLFGTYYFDNLTLFPLGDRAFFVRQRRLKKKGKRQRFYRMHNKKRKTCTIFSNTGGE